MEPYWTLRWQPPLGLSFSLLASATQDYAVILGMKYCTTWRLSHSDPKEVHSHCVAAIRRLIGYGKVGSSNGSMLKSA